MEKTTLALAVMSLGLAGCSSGNNDTVTATGVSNNGSTTATTNSATNSTTLNVTTVTGQVLTPSGGLTKALTGVASTPVLAFSISPDGTPTGSLLGQTTTDSNGTFSVTFLSSASNVIIQASGSTQPAPVGSAGTLSIPAIDGNLTPETEVATEALVAAAQQAGLGLSQLSAAGMSGQLAVVQSAAIDPALSSGTTGSIIALARLDLGALANATAQSLLSVNPPSVSGSYNAVSFNQGLAAQDESAKVAAGSLTLSGGQISGSLTNNKLDLAISNAALNETTYFQPSVTSTLTPSSSPDSLSAGVVQAGSFLTLATEGSSVAGASDPTGNVLIFPLTDLSTDNLGLGIGLRQGSGLATSILNGTYNTVQFGATFSYQANQAIDNFSFEGVKINSGSVTISGGAVVPNQTGAIQDQVLSILDSGTPPSFTLSGSVNTQATTGNGGGPTVTVSPSGVVSGPGVAGAVTPDGSLLALTSIQTSSQSNEVDLILGTAQGSGLSQSTLSGTYALTSQACLVGPTSLAPSVTQGYVVFDGQGNFQFSDSKVAATSTYVVNNFTVNTPPVDSGNFTTSVTYSNNGSTGSGTYTVSSNGSLSLTGTRAFSGGVTPNGNIVILQSQSPDYRVMIAVKVNSLH